MSPVLIICVLFGLLKIKSCSHTQSRESIKVVDVRKCHCREDSPALTQSPAPPATGVNTSTLCWSPTPGTQSETWAVRLKMGTGGLWRKRKPSLETVVSKLAFMTSGLDVGKDAERK